MHSSISLIAALVLIAVTATAEPVFDSHVHLWHGEQSLRDYEVQVKDASIDEIGFGRHVVRWPAPSLARPSRPDRGE